MSKQTDQATEQTPIVLRSVGVLFNQQAAAHNARVAGLVEMVAALRGELEERNILPFGKEGTVLFEADDETVVSELTQIEEYVTKGVRDEVEQMEDQDIIAATNNVAESFKRAMTLICYMDHIPLPTSMTLVDNISLAALHEYQMQYQQQLENEALEKHKAASEEQSQDPQKGADEE